MEELSNILSLKSPVARNDVRRYQMVGAEEFKQALLANADRQFAFVGIYSVMRRSARLCVRAPAKH